MTNSEEIEVAIRKTLQESQEKGLVVVPCSTLWEKVGNNRGKGDPLYGRYKSTLGKLITSQMIKVHRDDEESPPKGFELLKN